MDINICILLMGCICLFYTMIGGMEAVIWTDVAQVIILGGGAIYCLVWIAAGFPGGWNGMVELADANGKFRLLDFRWDLATLAFGVASWNHLPELPQLRHRSGCCTTLSDYS